MKVVVDKVTCTSTASESSNRGRLESGSNDANDIMDSSRQERCNGGVRYEVRGARCEV